MRRLIRSSDVVRFDDLPIPFRAVATDLVAGEPVVLSQGELSQALRASLSVGRWRLAPVRPRRPHPGRRRPDRQPAGWTWRRRDGPPTVAIVVDLGSARLSEQDPGNVAGGVSPTHPGHSDRTVRKKKSLALVRPDDILIRPDLGDFSSADFDHWGGADPVGAKRRHAKVSDRLAKLSLPA